MLLHHEILGLVTAHQCEGAPLTMLQLFFHVRTKEKTNPVVLAKEYKLSDTCADTLMLQYN